MRKNAEEKGLIPPNTLSWDGKDVYGENDPHFFSSYRQEEWDEFYARFPQVYKFVDDATGTPTPPDGGNAAAATLAWQCAVMLTTTGCPPVTPPAPAPVRGWRAAACRRGRSSAGSEAPLDARRGSTSPERRRRRGRARAGLTGPKCEPRSTALSAASRRAAGSPRPGIL